MGASLCIIDIIAEAQHILVEFIDILQCRLHLDAVGLSFEINRFMQCLFFLVQVADKSDDPLRLVIDHMLRLIQPLIVENDRQLGI